MHPALVSPGVRPLDTRRASSRIASSACAHTRRAPCLRITVTGAANKRPCPSRLPCLDSLHRRLSAPPSPGHKSRRWFWQAVSHHAEPGFGCAEARLITATSSDPLLVSGSSLSAPAISAVLALPPPLTCSRRLLHLSLEAPRRPFTTCSPRCQTAAFILQACALKSYPLYPAPPEPLAV